MGEKYTKVGRRGIYYVRNVVCGFVSSEERETPPENQFSARLNKLSSNPADEIRQQK